MINTGVKVRIGLAVLFLFSAGSFLFSQKSQKKYVLKKYFQVKFDQPLDMAEFPEEIKGNKYFAILEKKGKIFLVNQDENIKINLIDFTKKVCSRGFEEGLLGMAFDPDFIHSKKLYIYYSRCNPRETILSRIILSHPNKNNFKFVSKEEILLKIPQPYSNHNGGCIRFGPDGYLYIGTGDGGSAGDPHGNGQNKGVLLGKILRIDVNANKGYKIPAGNPFFRIPEIYAYGLRNPWRFSFDKKTGKLIVGDVGQDSYEEISIVKAGGNYGWNIMEGYHCFKPFKNCTKKNLILPIYEYDHSVGQSIIGGYIYYGSIKSFYGKYLFGDYVNGKIWVIDLNDFSGNAEEVLSSGLNIASFFQDLKGNFFVLSINKGEILKLSEN